jgi:hypothetical protein
LKWGIKYTDNTLATFWRKIGHFAKQLGLKFEQGKSSKMYKLRHYYPHS